MKFKDIKPDKTLFHPHHGYVKIISVMKDIDFIGKEHYTVNGQVKTGMGLHQYHSTGFPDDETGFTDPEVAPTMKGRVRGRCECGSWAVPGLENCHMAGCPEHEHNGLESSLKKE